MAKKNNTAEVAALPAGYVPALKKVYKEEIVPKLMKDFNYTTVMQCPKLVKITINEGVGDATGDKKLVESSPVTCFLESLSLSGVLCNQFRAFYLACLH